MSSYQAPQDEGYSEDPLTSQFSATPRGNTALSNSSEELPLSSIERYRDLRRSIHTLAAPKTGEEQAELYVIMEALFSLTPTSQIHELERNVIHPRLYIDFHHKLPAEICLKILGYLDPGSLLKTALTCVDWVALSMDRRLWRQLYFREGWRVEQAELDKLQAHITDRPMSINRERPSIDQVDGHADKRRATSRQSTFLHSQNEDTEMPDADNIPPPANPSLFGRQPSFDSAESSARIQDQENMSRSKPSAYSYPERLVTQKIPLGPRTFSDKDHKKRDPLDLTFMTSLLVQDRVQNNRFINWQYLYTQRRRLEANWESAKYVNFQLPHPDHKEEGHQQCIYTIQHSGKHLVSGSRDRTLRIWNLETRRLVMPPLTGHNGSVLCLQFDADPKEDVIISGSSDSKVNIWKFSTGELLQRLEHAHQESVLNVKFDHRILVTCSKDKTIKIFTRRALHPGDLGYRTSDGPVLPIPTVLNNYGFNPSPIANLSVKQPYTLIGTLEGHGAAVNAVQIHEKEVVSASGDRHIKIWDWPQLICKRTVVGHTKGIACVQYDGRRIVSGSSDNEVKVFDSTTGLEVASLRAHSNLVRTVQAGFGDLPYSAQEDQDDARAVDHEYFRAVDSGVVPRTLHRGQPRNAGSRRPEDIMAYGAKLPPGGGGGTYGRIVSGSYDETVIIWRRDKDGIWRARHTLRQADAALAASRDFDRASTRPASSPDVLHNPHQPGSTQFYRVAIENAVQGGSQALLNTLQQFPQLIQDPHLNAVISSQQPQSRVNTLRNAVRLAMLRQITNNPQLQLPLTTLPFPAASHIALPITPTPPVAPAPVGHSHHPLIDVPGSLSQPSGPALSQALGIPSNHSQAQTPAAPPTVAQAIAHIQNVAQDESSNHPALAQVPAQVMQGVAQAAAHSTVSAQTIVPAHAVGQVPAIAREAQAPDQARVFKLQFDARRIICCSQTNIIIGWDFANGDAKIEQASRFFASID